MGPNPTRRIIKVNDWVQGVLSGVLGFLLICTLFGNVRIGTLSNSNMLGRIFITAVIISVLWGIWYFN